MSAQGGTWQKDAADQNFDYMFKLLIIGNSSVGKTSFLFRYADDSFTSAFVSTVGIDFKVKTVFRQDKRVKLQIWVSRLLTYCISNHLKGLYYGLRRISCLILLTPRFPLVNGNLPRNKATQTSVDGRFLVLF